MWIKPYWRWRAGTDHSGIGRLFTHGPATLVSTRVILDADRFRLGKEAQCFVAAFASDAALLDSTKRRPQVAQQPTIHPYRATFQPLRDPVRPSKVARP